MFLFCLVFAMFCARLFICALWSPAGKRLTSWLSFVVSSVSLSLSHWYPGSGVVLDCIDSWSLHHYLLLKKSLYISFIKYTVITRPLVKSAYQKYNFLVSKPKHMLWVLKRTLSMRPFFWAPKTWVRNFTLKKCAYLNLCVTLSCF